MAVSSDGTYTNGICGEGRVAFANQVDPEVSVTLALSDEGGKGYSDHWHAPVIASRES